MHRSFVDAAAAADFDLLGQVLPAGALRVKYDWAMVTSVDVARHLG